MPEGIKNAMQVDFRHGHVQDDIFAAGKGYISSESIVFAVKARKFDGDGSPEVTDGDGNETLSLQDFIAVGLVENVTIAQQKNLQQLFEIGSREPYFIPGRTVIQGALNRVIFDGDSLLRVMYPTRLSEAGGGDGAAMPDYNNDEFNNMQNPPGQGGENGDLWFNLASEFFNKPFTGALLFYNDSAVLRGYIVLEKCYIEAHNMTMAAAQTVVTENVRLRASKITSMSSNAPEEEA